MKKLVLLFTSDVVVNLQPTDPEEEEFVDKILEGIATSKTSVPCG